MAPPFATRGLTPADVDAATILYDQLTNGPPVTDSAAFLRVVQHPGTTVFGTFEGTALRAMVTLHLLPNVTWSARPYGLLENVVTHRDHRTRGHGRRVLTAAISAAWDADAYKLMLMTGQARKAKGFYEALGFSDTDKFAMVLRQP